MAIFHCMIQCRGSLLNSANISCSCERTDLTEEGKSFLFGVEDLQEIASKSNRTLADSRWALPEDRIKAGLKPPPDKMETMPPPIKPEGPNLHAFHQKILLGTGLNSSRWAASSSFNSK